MPKTKGFGKNPTLKFGSRFWGDLLYSTGTKISQPGECGLIVVRRRANLGKNQKIHVFSKNRTSNLLHGELYFY